MIFGIQMAKIKLVKGKHTINKRNFVYVTWRVLSVINTLAVTFALLKIYQVI
jgi:hypothetical protein